MRTLFFKLLIPILLLSSGLSYYYPSFIWLSLALGILIFIGFLNTLQHKHAILRNFPILGYFRYFFEFISPELQQYFIERDTDGRPFSRHQRALAYERAKNVDATHPFGTQLDINQSSYEGLRHSIYPAPVLQELPRTTIGSAHCKQPYSASLLNISAMSFGSLSANAVLALNKGAEQGHFYHNTGEGGLTEYHLQGADVVWQIGTGYFGCRTEDGHFDPDKFKKKATHPNVKMIELKISQGAKPGHGGVLPAVKNSPQIAEIRGIQPHTDVLSPPGHSAFSNAQELVHFIQTLRELSDYKPVGFKLCIGQASEFVKICEVMKEEQIFTDFITVDGAEGGTGAAPLEFSDGVGMPLEPALIFVHQTLEQLGIRDKVKLIASGKVLTGTSLIRALAIGADLCNSARGFLFSLGCIQALRCNTNKCPTGVATQNKMLMKGLVVNDKKDRVQHYHHNTLKSAMELLAACGKKSFDDASIDMFMRGDEFVKLADLYYPDNFATTAKA